MSANDYFIIFLGQLRARIGKAIVRVHRAEPMFKENATEFP
jgi:hypothetical protein